MIRKCRIILAAMAILALVAAGCSSKTETTGTGGPTGSGTPASGTTVKAIDSAFDPRDITVKVGTTLTWDFVGSLPHTVTADDGSFDSGTKNKGATFTQTFTSAGTFKYHCTLHGGKGGVGMAGTVTVTS